MPDVPPLSACRVVTSEISARILIAAQLHALSEFSWTVVAGDAPTVELPGIRHVCIQMRREFAFSDFRSFTTLLRYFRANEFAFVQTHTPKASMLALPAARLAGHRTMYTMHGALCFRGNGRLANLAGWIFERWCCSWAHLVAMQSEEDTTALPRARVCPRRKVRYQGNGIELDRFTPEAPEAPELGPEPAPPPDRLPVILNISRLVKEKGCLDFFALAEHLGGRATFVHVGPTEADQRDAVDPALIADLERRGVVHFVGEVADVRPYLAGADLFVLPSFREGIPRGCMEAAAFGLPIVAYDVRGVREVVPGGHQLLAPRGDQDALAAIVRRLLDDPTERAHAAAACTTHVHNRFDERFVYERLRAIYAELLASG